MGDQKKRTPIILIVSISVLVFEAGLIWYYFEEIMEFFIQNNWWVTLLSFVTIRGAIVLAKTVLIKGCIAVLWGWIIDVALKFLIGKRRLDIIKSKVSYWVEVSKKELMIRWNNYNRFSKAIIIFVILQIVILIIGTILYIPLGRRKAVGFGQKKTGLKIVSRFLAFKVFQAPIVWFLSLKFVRYIKTRKISRKIKRKMHQWFRLWIEKRKKEKAPTVCRSFFHTIK